MEKIEIDTKKHFIKLNNFRVYIIAAIVASLNVLFSSNYLISLSLVFVELMILMYLLIIKKDITKYVGYYLIFLCLSFEFDVLVGAETFYGFKEFRIMGINLGIVTLLPILVLILFKNISINRIKKQYPELFRFSSMIIIFAFTGIFFGLLQILTNDNNIAGMTNTLSLFIGSVYNTAAIPVLMIVSFGYLITYEKDRVFILETYLVAVLIGVVVSMVVSLIFGNFGRYGGVNTLLVTNTIRYIPFMLLFPFYSKYRYMYNTKIVFALGFIGAILSLMFNATGKTIILYGLVPFGIIGLLLKRKKISILPIIFLLIPISIYAIYYITNILASNSILFNSKINQVISIVKFWEDNWIFNMPLSPRIRIVEFISIFREYLAKPWFLVFGKGYMGTIIDHTGMLSTVYTPGAYSQIQWANGTFYKVHEALNILFLYNGFLGVLFYLYMLKNVFTNYVRNPWILIGGFWFLIVYGYSVTMTAFGIASLLLGYVYLGKNKEESY